MSKSLKEIMTTNLITVQETDALESFENYCKNRSVHHILVLDDYKKLKGIISSQDIAKSQSWITKDKLIAAHIMTENPITIHQDAPISVVVAHFLENRYRAIPVTNDDGELAGIITPYDLLASNIS